MRIDRIFIVVGGLIVGAYLGEHGHLESVVSGIVVGGFIAAVAHWIKERHDEAERRLRYSSESFIRLRVFEDVRDRLEDQRRSCPYPDGRTVLADAVQELELGITNLRAEGSR